MIYRKTYEDVYKLHAKFGRIPVEARDGIYWEELVTEMGELSKAHPDEFSTTLIVAVVRALEAECTKG